MTAALIGSAAAAAAPAVISGLASVFGRSKPKASPLQKQQSQLFNQLMEGFQGRGSSAGLFAADEESFQKQFADPARQRFQSQTAPQIQQSFLASGQQRGTGLEDELTRAGVDMEQLLNQEFNQFQQGAQNRQLSAMNAIMGGQGGVPAPGPSKLQAFGQGVAGGFADQDTASNFAEKFANIFKGSPAGSSTPQRKGFQPKVFDQQLPNFFDRM